MIHKQTVLRHKEVLALRCIKKNKYLISVGTEGDILVQMMDEFSSLIATHKLLWDQVSICQFISDSEILFGNIITNESNFLGLNVGGLQYMKFNWNKNERDYSSIIQFHNAPIRHIATLASPGYEVHLDCHY
jgi:hypothetical protein